MIYDIIFIIFSILYLPHLLISGKWRGFSRQRLGIFDAATLSLLKTIGKTNPLWIHAVSVGEVMATVPLCEELKKNYPGENIIISTVTPTGNRIAQAKLKGATAVIYLPVDLSRITDKVVRLINPRVVLIAETEIWPNFIMSLNKIGAKVVIFNGRVSKNSFKNYNFVKPILKNVLNMIDLYLMQSQADASKIVSLGAPQDRVKVTGNLKYDAALMKDDEYDAASLRRKLGLESGDKLLVAGSTHPGEEEMILHSYKELLLTEFPGLRLMIAPRHVNRAQVIAGDAQMHGFKARLVSKADDRVLDKDEILILDVMGKLAWMYAAADLVFIGGSLINKGGQNPLEAAYYSKAILFGSHMHNFGEIADSLVSAKAAVKVESEAKLTSSLRVLLRNESECHLLGENARRVLESNAGVAAKDAEFIEKIIKPRGTKDEG